MSIWLIADTHFGHRNMVKLCERPDDFEARILHAWKRIVAPTDTVIHLGDVCLCGAQEEKRWMATIKEELSGIKILVKGNHDKRAFTWYEANGFALCVDKLVRVVNGRRCLFTHAPVVMDTAQKYECALNVHGHLHTNAYLPIFGSTQTSHRLFSLERTHYLPVEIGSFIDKFKAYS